MSECQIESDIAAGTHDIARRPQNRLIAFKQPVEQRPTLMWAARLPKADGVTDGRLRHLVDCLKAHLDHNCAFGDTFGATPHGYLLRDWFKRQLGLTSAMYRSSSL